VEGGKQVNYSGLTGKKKLQRNVLIERRRWFCPGLWLYLKFLFNEMAMNYGANAMVKTCDSGRT
jgi:hypothetical protein